MAPFDKPPLSDSANHITFICLCFPPAKASHFLKTTAVSHNLPVPGSQHNLWNKTAGCDLPKRENHLNLLDITNNNHSLRLNFINICALLVMMYEGDRRRCFEAGKRGWPCGAEEVSVSEKHTRTTEGVIFMVQWSLCDRKQNYCGSNLSEETQVGRRKERSSD